MSTKDTSFLRGIILLGFTMFIFKLLVTGEIANFIAPRMYPFMYFAVIVFGILGIFQVWTSSSSKKNHDAACTCCHHDHSKGPIKSVIIYSLFIIPILTGFAFSDSLMDSSVAQKRGVKFSGAIQSSSNNGSEEKVTQETEEGQSEKSLAELYLEDPDKYMEELEEKIEGDTESIEEVVVGPPDGYYDELYNELITKDKIEITDDRFIQMLSTLEMNVQDFQGKEVEMVGFVYREDDFDENEAVIARFGVSCCVADASVYGAFSKSDSMRTIKTDSWVKVSGIIEKKDYNGYILPYINITSLEKIDAPLQAYVYETY